MALAFAQGDLTGEDYGTGQSRELAEPDGDRHGSLFEALGAPLPSHMRARSGSSVAVPRQSDRCVLDNRCSGDRHFGTPLCSSSIIGPCVTICSTVTKMRNERRWLSY